MSARSGSRKAAALAFLLAVSLMTSACSLFAAPPPADFGDNVVVSAFSSEYIDFETATDIAFSKDVAERLAYVGGDPATGGRTSGSPAGMQAAEIVESAMRRAGLSDVTRDRVTADTWTFTGAKLIYHNRRDEQKTARLGGYPVNLTVSGEALMLLDLGRGEAADYEGRDVTGKLVLIDFDPARDGSLSYPVTQARLKGARAVLAMIRAEETPKDRVSEGLVSANFDGPSDAPVLAVSEADATALRAEIKHTDGDALPVVLNADSRVALKAAVENLWGDIPGESDEVIYVTARYDGFYHAMTEGAAGAATVLGVAKALIDSGFTPRKTIRFLLCGAGTWGATNTPFRYGTGAWKQIAETRPDWAESAVAVLDFGGAQPVARETRFGLAASDELFPFTETAAGELIATAMYEYARYRQSSLPGRPGDDISWSLAGIPSAAVVAGENTAKYFGLYAHGEADSPSAAFDDAAFRFNHLLCGKLILELDDSLIRPVDFGEIFRAVTESAAFSDRASAKSRLLSALSDAGRTAEQVTAGIARTNLEYRMAADLLKPSMEGMSFGLNRELFRVLKQARDDLWRVTWQGEAAFPHVNTHRNIEALRAALDALNARDARSAFEILQTVDLSRYAARFDRETCDRLAGAERVGAWAQGRAERPPCRTDDILRALSEKLDDEHPETSAEAEAVNALIAQEDLYLREILAAEAESVTALNARLEQLLADYFGEGDAPETEEAGDTPDDRTDTEETGDTP